MNNTKIRFATEADTALILGFIRELAAYEKMSDQVVADEALLREWIFEKKKAEVLFAQGEANAKAKYERLKKFTALYED